MHYEYSHHICHKPTLKMWAKDHKSFQGRLILMMVQHLGRASVSRAAEILRAWRPLKVMGQDPNYVASMSSF